MSKAFRWLAPIIFIGVSVFLLLFFISINSHDEIYVEEIPVDDTIEKKTQLKNTWLDHLSQNEKLGYFYPVNEVYVKVNLDKEIPRNTIYKLSTSVLDPYQLFCLKEELKFYKFKYYLSKKGDNVQLFIYSKNSKKLNALVDKLSQYKISAKVNLYKEEK